MRFWLQYRFEPVGQAPIVTDNPKIIAALKEQGQPARKASLRVMLGTKKLVVNQEYETKDPTECKALIKCGQILFNPQDAVDEGIFTAGEMAALGHPVCEVDPADVKDPEVPEPEQTLPDFDAMTKDHLIEWGDKQDPPIRLKKAMRQNDMVKMIREALNLK